MSWRNTPPKRSDYDSNEEYDEALDFFYDAIEADYEERRNR